MIGSSLQGLNNYLLPALLHNLEHLPSYVIETPDTNIQVKSFFQQKHVSVIFIEFRSQNTLKNVRQNLPAVIVLSRIDTWWDLVEDGVQIHIVSALEDFHANLPLLLVATCSKGVPPKVSCVTLYTNLKLSYIRNMYESIQSSLFISVIFIPTLFKKL